MSASPEQGVGKPGLSLGCLAPPVGKAEARNQAHDSTWLGTQDAEGEGLSMAANGSKWQQVHFAMGSTSHSQIAQNELL